MDDPLSLIDLAKLNPDPQETDMSFLDKLASAIMPPESDQDRLDARRNAEAAAMQGGWLSIVLDHHRQIEQAFARAASGPDSASRKAALKTLVLVLTGHANAEESVIYPMMTKAEQKAHATMAYEEQAMTKVQMALLEQLDTMSLEWLEKLEHIKGAVLHHVYEEEGEWFPRLQAELPESENQRITGRFIEEFERYTDAEQTAVPMQMAAQDRFESE
jgi:hemerythrin superfamily protein